MIAQQLLELLRDPVTGEPLEQLSASENGAGGTGVLRSSSREYPVVGGVVLMREEFATRRILRCAREGDFAGAAFWALRADGMGRREAMTFVARLHWPRLLQWNGSPCGVLRGDAGTYFRYRYSVPNVPTCIGVLSCLNRAAAANGYVLDVGCGYGHFYPYLRHSYPAERIVLLDCSLRALLTASRFTDAGTLLVCCRADQELPFRKGAFVDIVALNAFAYLERQETFLQHALDLLAHDCGTLWLSNNWNPPATTDHTGNSRPPSQWRERLEAPNWRIFPDRHFAQAVMKGCLINLAVNHVPQDGSPDWRSYTLAYSNWPWEVDNKLVPLNQTPRMDRLHANPIYRGSLNADWLEKRNVSVAHWATHEEYFGLELPRQVPLTQGRGKEQELRRLAGSLVVLETLSPYVESALRSPAYSARRRLGSYLSRSRLVDAVYPLVPGSIKALGKRLFTAS